MLICYHRKDTVEEMLIKSGAIAKKKKKKGTATEHSPVDDHPSQGQPQAPRQNQAQNQSQNQKRVQVPQQVQVQKVVVQQTQQNTRQQVQQQQKTIPVQKAVLHTPQGNTKKSHNVAMAASGFSANSGTPKATSNSSSTPKGKVVQKNRA